MAPTDEDGKSRSTSANIFRLGPMLLLQTVWELSFAEGQNVLDEKTKLVSINSV